MLVCRRKRNDLSKLEDDSRIDIREAGIRGGHCQITDRLAEG
jgi:hypothetical protein